MKILILSASIGSGHTQAAEAIAEQFRMRNTTNNQIESLDFMDKEVSILNWLLKKLYLSVLGLIPDLYDRIYKLAGVRRFGSITRLIWSTLMYLPFSKLLNKLNPNIIICTHPFPEAAAALWKFLHPNHSKKFILAAVLTDYSLHEIWIYGGVDMYFVATEEMKQELESHGNFKVFATGIPIRSQFQIEKRKINLEKLSELKELPNSNYELSITHSALIMGGGLGLGSFEETIKALEEINFDLKIIVVTGKNESLKTKLESIKSKHEIIILGFVDNISELMQNSDILITKPGALTLSEAFAAGLPTLLLPPIPGPEALNAEYAVKHGSALSLSNSVEITNAISIVNNVEQLDRMRENAKKISRPNAAAEIVNKILDN